MTLSWNGEAAEERGGIVHGNPLLHFLDFFSFLTSFRASAQRHRAKPLGGNGQRYFTCGNFVSVSVFRKATIASSSAGVRPRLPTSLVMLAAYSGAGQPAPGTSRVL